MKPNIYDDIEQFIFPILKHLKRNSGKINRKYIEAIEDHLQKLNRSVNDQGHVFPVGYPLTMKEKEICYLIKSGLTTKEIADILCVSLRTIEHHRNHIRKKIGISKKDINLYQFLISL